MPDEAEENRRFKKFLSERLKTRRYADTWFPGRRSQNQTLDKWISEKICVEHFQQERPKYQGSLFQPQFDPPDVGINLRGNITIGCEVTELVHSDTIRENIPYFKNDDRSINFKYTNYHTPEGEALFQSQLLKIIETKNQKLERRKSKENFDHFILLIVSDEPFLQESLVERFLSTATFIPSIFDEVFLMLSYHPRLDKEGNCPVFTLY